MRLGPTTKFRIRYSRIANEPLKVLHKYANWNFFDYYSRTFQKEPQWSHRAKILFICGGTLMTIRFVRVN